MRRAAMYAGSMLRASEVARTLASRLCEMGATAEAADEWLDAAFTAYRLWHAHLAPQLHALACDPSRALDNGRGAGILSSGVAPADGHDGGGGDEALRYYATRDMSGRALDAVSALFERLRAHLHCNGEGVPLPFLDGRAKGVRAALARAAAPTAELLAALDRAEAAADAAGARDALGALAMRMDEARAADAVNKRAHGAAVSNDQPCACGPTRQVITGG
ncbi:hypothetical protein T492DRAFT_919342 [Pavlovales sp. CCMP2436]|nr:hypothetical protein T492DRAFT_919342 [Pavlovales sp. CCMP2436]